MMTPKKPAMADLSGGKRDRHPDNTDSPVTTPDARDAKLSRWDPDGAEDNNANDKEIMEDCDFVDFTESDSKKPSADKEHVVDLTANHALIKAGGLEHGDDDDEEAHSPKKLFSDLFKEGDADVEAKDEIASDKETVETDKKDHELTIKHKHEKIDHNIKKTIDANKEKTEKKNHNNNKNKNDNNNNNNNNDEEDDEEDDDDEGDPTQGLKVLDLTSPKRLTSKWKGLDKMSKELSPYLSLHRHQAKEEMAKALKHFDKDPDTITTRDEWVKVFSSAHTAVGRCW